MRPSPADLLILGVLSLWVVNLGLHLARSRIYWITFWALVAGLPALAFFWFSTPWHTPRNANFGAGMPVEYVYGVLAFALWAVVLVLELVVFIILKVREGRSAR